MKRICSERPIRRAHLSGGLNQVMHLLSKLFGLCFLCSLLLILTAFFRFNGASPARKGPRAGVWPFELDELQVVQTGLVRGSGSGLFDLRFLLRLRRIDFRPRRRLPDVQEAVLAQGADGIAVG